MTRIRLHIDRIVIETREGEAPFGRAERAQLTEALQAELTAALLGADTAGGLTPVAVDRVAVDTSAAGHGVGAAVLNAVGSATGGWPGAAGGAR
jgi:hypothetical protein